MFNDDAAFDALAADVVAAAVALVEDAADQMGTFELHPVVEDASGNLAVSTVVAGIATIQRARGRALAMCRAGHVEGVSIRRAVLDAGVDLVTRHYHDDGRPYLRASWLPERVAL
jgi:hypothetical protein